MNFKIHLRQASIDDADEVAELFLTTRRTAMPYLPILHTDDQTRQWIAKVVFVQCAVWVAETHGRIAGFMALVGDRLEHLYILPAYQRHGIGSRLLGKAKQLSPQRLELYVFQQTRRRGAFIRRMVSPRWSAAMDRAMRSGNPTCDASGLETVGTSERSERDRTGGRADLFT